MTSVVKDIEGYVLRRTRLLTRRTANRSEETEMSYREAPKPRNKNWENNNWRHPEIETIEHANTLLDRRPKADGTSSDGLSAALREAAEASERCAEANRRVALEYARLARREGLQR